MSGITVPILLRVELDNNHGYNGRKKRNKRSKVSSKLNDATFCLLLSFGLYFCTILQMVTLYSYPAH